ncbi:MAG TPA: hypothetical protein VL326_23720 [Kofleriaceae bacterium]|nr:hypothetical protein [Kofleriaceae bacterium]
MSTRALCAFAVACAAVGCGDNTHLTGGSLLITPEIGLRTNETGAAATFNVSLTSEPSKDIDVAIASLDLAEGTAEPAMLHFTPATYDRPQLVSVRGVDDAKADGNKTFIVRVDGGRRGVVDLSIVNDDDDTAGFVVSPLIGLMTSESGSKASFTVRLLSQPAADVTVPVQTSDATEGTTNVSSLTFTEQDWNVDQTVMVTGMSDALADGTVPYSIVLAPAMSADLVYKGLDPDDPLLQNLDANVNGVTVTPGSGLATTEAAGTDTFQVVLQSAPTANVTFAVSSTDTTEATASTTQLLFTPQNWMTPQVVTVTGVNDFVVDGAQPFTITLGAATTTDPIYVGIDPPDVAGANADNDTAGIIVTGGASGLTTSEAMTSDSFSVTLQSQPTANVTIGVSSSDTTEGQVSPASLVLTPADWNQPHTVTVTGQNDSIVDGDQTYTIVLAAATSSDALYNGMNAPDVTAVNVDNDLPGFTVDTSSLVVSEFQDADFFTIMLNTPPSSNVTLTFTSTDTTEGTVLPNNTLTFTPQNWNVAQTMYVTGVNDTVPDGPITFSITGTATSSDAAYNNLATPVISVVNIDNDTATVYVKARNRLMVSESGQSATFRVRLTVAPTAPVTCTLQSGDTTEATVNPTSLTFTPGQFGFQTVTVTGVDDALVDGDISLTILLNACTSSDLAYNGSNPRDVAVTNRDND